MARATIVMAAVMALASAAWAGPLNKDQVSGDAKWVVHLDVQAATASQVGQWALKRLADHGLDAKLKDFTTLFGFDPTKDLKGVTLYGARYEEADAVAVIQANVDKAKLLDLLAKNDGHAEIAYGDRTIHKWSEKRGGEPVAKFGCFAAADLTMISGNLDVLKSALDVLDGEKASLAKGGLAVLPEPSPGSILLLAADDLVVPEQAKHKAVLDRVKSVSVEVGEADGQVYFRDVIIAKAAEDGAQVRRLLNGLLAMVALFGQSDDQAADPVRAEALAMLGAIRVGGQDATVTIEGAWDVEKVTGLLEKAAARKGRQGAEAQGD